MPEEKMTEQELVQGCIANKRKHQEAFYRKFFPAMTGMTHRYTSDPELAMTIVNNGFLKAFKNMESFAFKGSLEGWLRRIVYRCMADHFRSNKHNVHFLIFEDYDSTTAPDVLSDLYLDDIFEMINRIPKNHGEVFRLFAIEGYSHNEIAEKLDINPNTSRWYLSVAREKLRELIAVQNKINYGEKRI